MVVAPSAIVELEIEKIAKKKNGQHAHELEVQLHLGLMYVLAILISSFSFFSPSSGPVSSFLSSSTSIALSLFTTLALLSPRSSPALFECARLELLFFKPRFFPAVERTAFLDESGDLRLRR